MSETLQATLVRVTAEKGKRSQNGIKLAGGEKTSRSRGAQQPLKEEEGNAGMGRLGKGLEGADL